VGKKKKSTGKFRKFLWAVFGVIALSAIVTGYTFYQKIYAPNVNFTNGQYLYVPTGSTYQQLLNLLKERNIVHSIEHFDWVSQKMNLPANVHAGRYRLEKNMSNYELVGLLRSGKQEPVRFVINKFRLKEDLAGFVSSQLEADSLALITYLNNKSKLEQYDVDPQTADDPVHSKYLRDLLEHECRRVPAAHEKRI
jgi:UPF0755 protein